MRAVIMRDKGGPDVLDLCEMDEPRPGVGQVQIEIAATALNRADLLQRRGLYPAPPDSPADILGLEYAGHVAWVGPGVRTLKEGDRVMGIVGGGAYAQKVVVPERQVLRVPRGLSLAEAAAIPEAFETAYDALFVQGALSVGQTLLIHAAGSGVGTAAVQLAKVAGVHTIGTSRSAAKLERCAELGLDTSVVAVDGEFSREVREQAAEGVDVVVDLVGGAYLAENIRAVRSGGTLVVVGLLGGASATINLAVLLAKRITLRGTVLRSRSHEEKCELAQQVARTVVPLFEDQTLVPVVHATFPMDKVREAHAEMESNLNVGKIVLTW